mgnify:CR=1 FL=1
MLQLLCLLGLLALILLIIGWLENRPPGNDFVDFCATGLYFIGYLVAVATFIRLAIEMASGGCGVKA